MMQFLIGENVCLFAGHIFQLTIINIPTACEICQLFLLWPIERGLVRIHLMAINVTQITLFVHLINYF